MLSSLDTINLLIVSLIDYSKSYSQSSTFLPTVLKYETRGQLSLPAYIIVTIELVKPIYVTFSNNLLR